MSLAFEDRSDASDASPPSFLLASEAVLCERALADCYIGSNSIDILGALKLRSGCLLVSI